MGLFLTTLSTSSMSQSQVLLSPKKRKTAIVTPVPKKGDECLYENYRPVSCLPAAAKLLESLVCNQVSNYMEEKKAWNYVDLLSKNASHVYK